MAALYVICRLVGYKLCALDDPWCFLGEFQVCFLGVSRFFRELQEGYLKISIGLRDALRSPGNPLKVLENL